MSESLSILSCKSLSVGYYKGKKDFLLLDQIALNFKAGELIALLGANGAGKSSLIRTLAGMQPALNGEVFYGENQHPLASMDVKERAKWFGVVLTERNTFGQLSVFELIALGRTPYTGWLGRLKPDDLASIDQALQAVGMESYRHTQLDTLSDGEYQKVMIARVLAQDTPIIFLDEPTAFIDVPGKVEVMRLLHRLAVEHQKVILLSTHDLDMALQSADRVCVFTGNASLAVGTPEDMVLQGVFSQAFDRNEVSFDEESGRFVIQKHSCVGVQLEASGLQYEWTKRALLRKGFSVEATASVRIIVSEDTEGSYWQVEENTYRSIDALLQALLSPSFIR